MLKSRKTVSVLVRDGSRLNEKLAFKRQNSKFAVDFALLRKNHGKRSKKYGTMCGRPKRSLAENGAVRTRSADKFGSPAVFFRSILI
jgi:hypothetical protein